MVVAFRDRSVSFSRTAKSAATGETPRRLGDELCHWHDDVVTNIRTRWGHAWAAAGNRMDADRDLCIAQ